MKKLSELKGTDFVVVEIPALMGVDQKTKQLFEKVATKRAVITKQGFAFYKSDGEVDPILVGTPSGEMDAENPYIIGYIPFENEGKETPIEVKEVKKENISDPRGKR
jgi:hypothetical protein